MSVKQPTGARPAVQLSYGNPKDPVAAAEHRRQLAQGINRLNRGQANVTLFLTLDPNKDSTVVTDSRISTQTCIALQPQTADAAGALATTWIVCTNGSATVYHANNTETDRTFTLGMAG